MTPANRYLLRLFKWSMLSLSILVAVIMLTSCSSFQEYKERNSVLDKFFEVLGTGDTSKIKKHKKSTETDIWKEIEENKE